MEAALGFILCIVTVVLLVKQWGNNIFAFVIVPPIFALLAGYTVSETSKFIKSGVSSTMSAALIAMFAMTFFSIVSEAGIFTPITNWILKTFGSNSTVAVCLAAAAVTHVAHLDTSGTSTVLVVIPTMLPLFKKLKINPCYLYAIMAMGMGNLNKLPWSSSVALIGSIIGEDPTTIFRMIAPSVAVTTVFNFIAAYFIGKLAARKPFDFEEHGIISAFAQGNVEIQEVAIDKRFILNWLLTIGAFILIFQGDLQSYYVFMLVMVLALAVNYKGVKEWNKAIDRFAPSILRMAMMVFTAGVFVGILTESNMMSAMAESIINIIPTSANNSFGLITTAISYVTDPLFTNDAYYAGVLPLFMTVAESISYPAMSVCVAILLIRDSMQQVSPAQSRPWQMSAMLGVEYIDCMKALLPPLTIQIVLQIIVAVATGAIAI